MQKRRAEEGKRFSFFGEGADRLKVGPTTVLVLSFVFMAAVVSLHILSKVKQAVVPGASSEQEL